MVLQSVTFQELYLTLIISQVQLLVGFGYSFSAFLIPKIHLTNDSTLNSAAVSWIATSGLIIRPIGNILDVFVIDKLGRRGTIRLKVSLMALSWCVVALSRSTITFCIGRAINSLAIGFVATKSIYISETCSEKRRASLLAITLFFMSLGIIVVNLLEYMFSWKTTAVIACILAISTLLQTTCIPETKYWYMLKNRKRDAFRSSLWFKNKKNMIEIQEELNKIERSILKVPDKLNWFQLMHNPIILKPLFLTIFLLLSRVGTGYVIFIHYTVNFFSSLQSIYNSEKLSIYISILDLIGSTLFTLVADKFNRKTIMYYSVTIMLPSIATVGVYSHLYGKLESEGYWLPVACIFIYMFVHSSAHFSIILVIGSEIFPSSIRGPILSFCFLIMHIAMSVYIFYYPIMVDNFGMEFICWFFFINTLLSLTITIYLPETSSLPLHQSEELFENELKTESVEEQLLPGLSDEGEEI